MKIRIYLDTSVISALDDERLPTRQGETRDFFNRRDEFDFVTSGMADEEIRGTRDLRRRAEMLLVLESIPQLEVTAEALKLAQEYANAGIFGDGQMEDATHVAVAVVSRIPLLVSWNFKHLVNRRRQTMVLAINAAFGYQTIEILAPPEV